MDLCYSKLDCSKVNCTYHTQIRRIHHRIPGICSQPDLSWFPALILPCSVSPLIKWRWMCPCFWIAVRVKWRHAVETCVCHLGAWSLAVKDAAAPVAASLFPHPFWFPASLCYIPSPSMYPNLHNHLWLPVGTSPLNTLLALWLWAVLHAFQLLQLFWPQGPIPPGSQVSTPCCSLGLPERHLLVRPASVSPETKGNGWWGANRQTGRRLRWNVQVLASVSPGCEFQFCHLLGAGLYVSLLALLCLYFLSVKWQKIEPASWGCWED